MSDNNISISSLTKLKYINKILRPKEKIIFYLSIILFVVSLLAGSIRYYLLTTKVMPTNGGEYTEGIAVDSSGIPTTINPILATTRPIDELISSLIFSSLFKYDNQGQLINDLVKDYSISNDGKKYILHLKNNIYWHDGKPLTAEDVVFTVHLFQDTNYNPVSDKEWNKKTITVKTDNEHTVIFNLSESYAPFLNKLTFGILPKHLWETVPSDKFSLTDLNLQPVGSGPFIFDKIKKNANGEIITYKLIANKNFYAQKPYLDRLIFNFYANENDVIDAYNKKEISGFGFSNYNKVSDFNNRKDTNIYALNVPQYFSVLLNQTESIPLADNKVRQAIQLATNRDELIKNIFNNYAEKITTPLIKPFISNFDFQEEYSPEKARQLLEEAGWKTKTGETFRKKDGTELKFTMVTTVGDLLKTAELLKKQWEKVGIKIEIISSENKLDIKQKYLTPRKYESILFGLQYSGNDPNLFFFWHSTGKKNPGLNFALYDNEEVDKLLEESKKITNLKEKNEKYAEVSKHLLQDNPAIFLYSPKYIYIISKKIKGINNQAIINISHRLTFANNWYVKTKRIRK